MKQFIFILFVFIAFIACEKTKIGYLEVDDASYDPNSMVVFQDPDPESYPDRVEKKYPWVSPQIQGVLGTLPIFYKIERVHTTDGDVASFYEEVKLRGDSSFEIPFDNSIKKGTYYVDVNIYNKGYSHVRDSLFILIVK
ncbi:hypothetical protein [Sanguibacteroides sp. AM78-02pH3A]|uniref:hypothetical protein n=1 Tax=Sanguibacteroides sp. AM78-02pH3A TaxID=3002646 RepID=UPI0022E4F81B|nr:hypothetical protein [Sanguibacteroides sp. AM78-02pH3A]